MYFPLNLKHISINILSILETYYKFAYSIHVCDNEVYLNFEADYHNLPLSQIRDNQKSLKINENHSIIIVLINGNSKILGNLIKIGKI